MGKRKTRKEKIIADLRRQLHTAASSPSVVETEKINEPFYRLSEPSLVQTSVVQTLVINDYASVISDLKKTAVVVTLLATAQVLLFSFLKTHIITIPFLNY